MVHSDCFAEVLVNHKTCESNIDRVKAKLPGFVRKNDSRAICRSKLDTAKVHRSATLNIQRLDRQLRFASLIDHDGSESVLAVRRPVSGIGYGRRESLIAELDAKLRTTARVGIVQPHVVNTGRGRIELPERDVGEVCPVANRLSFFLLANSELL